MYYSVLYSNKKLLYTYNKRIPKKWEDLLDTAKYILGKERKNSNESSKIIGYNGMFTGKL